MGEWDPTLFIAKVNAYQNVLGSDSSAITLPLSGTEASWITELISSAVGAVEVTLRVVEKLPRA